MAGTGSPTEERWRRLPLRFRPLLIVAWALANGTLIGYALDAFLVRPGSQNDWGTWQIAAKGLATGTLYDNGIFIWSPTAAWILRYLVLPLGYPFWIAMHVAVVLLLRDRFVSLLVITSGPFWVDALAGNFFTFVFVAAFLAIRGSRSGAVMFLALSLLMPRPLQLPLAAWLIIRERGLRLPAAALVASAAGLVILSGEGGEWLSRLAGYSEAYPFRGWDLGPTRWLGSWWLVAGVPLSIWLTLRNRPAWAGLALSPYVVPQYLLLPLIDVGRDDRPPSPKHSR